MKKAIIYVRGHRQEMQEIFCKMYAEDMGYKVLFVTTDIEAVNNCDLMIATNASRISRNRFEYHTIVKNLKKKGIEVEYALNHDNADENLPLVMDILK